MPEQVTGSISDDNEVLEQDVRIWLSEGQQTWQGSFAVAHGSKISITGLAQYSVALQDGRCGRILITGYKPTTSGIEVTFQGSGPLQKLGRP